MNTKKKGILHAHALEFATGGKYKSHELKSWPEHFQKVWSREKTFELRKNDRDFNLGDYVTLLEYIPEGRELNQGGSIRISAGEYTGEWIRFRITDIFDSNNALGLPLGVVLGSLVILSFKVEDQGRLSGAKALQERLI